MAVDKKFIINRQGKDYVLYAGLLQEAHKQFPTEFEMKTEILELEPKPILHAEFSGFNEKDGRRVKTSGIGAANRQGDEKSPAARTAPIEMAETRAKARALRDATNIGMTAFEELGGDDEDQPQASEKQGRSSSKGSPGGPSRKSSPEAAKSNPRSQQQNSQEEEPPPPEPEPSDMGQPLATSRQQKELTKLCGELKPSMTEDEAVGAFEDKLGHPIGLLSESDAAGWIERLNKSKRQSSGRSSSGD